MPRPYSEDLRWQAIWMIEILGFEVDEVSAACGCRVRLKR